MMVDLIVFKVLDFNMILGMDFLGGYKVKIYYRKKKVQFSLDNGDWFELRKG